jgi:hypothetical protein
MARHIVEVVIETDCGHGDVIGAAHDWVEKWHAWVPCSADTVGAECSAEHCPGGSRRVLDPGSLIRALRDIGCGGRDTCWDPDAENWCQDIHKPWFAVETEKALLDALAGGEQP